MTSRPESPASAARDPVGMIPMRDNTPAELESADPFAEHRRLLFATAYRMLGTVTDTEDVLQDAWISWHGADRSSVRNPRAYLVRTVVNLALNRLTSARATRETYVGPWLPEPLLTEPSAAEETEMAADVSTAMLVVLETLSPVERAVFVLREVFGFSHAEIAGFIERPEATVRQIAHRARAHVQARRPRCDSDAAGRREITEKFLAASHGGDVNALMELLAPEVTLWNDGGGKITAARRPLYGPDHVARWLLGVMAKPVSAGMRMTPAVINGELGLLVLAGEVPVGALTYDLLDGRMLNMRFQVNPDKLRGLHSRAESQRRNSFRELLPRSSIEGPKSSIRAGGRYSDARRVNFDLLRPEAGRESHCHREHTNERRIEPRDASYRSPPIARAPNRLDALGIRRRHRRRLAGRPAGRHSSTRLRLLPGPGLPELQWQLRPPPPVGRQRRTHGRDRTVPRRRIQLQSASSRHLLRSRRRRALAVTRTT